MQDGPASRRSAPLRSEFSLGHLCLCTSGENQRGESGGNGGIRKRVVQAMGTKRQIHSTRSHHYFSFAMG
jgi:hypothetical protein